MNTLPKVGGRRRPVVRYQVWRGVNHSHLYIECAGYFERLKDARATYDALPEKISLTFKTLLAGTAVAEKVTIVAQNWT